jgi:hypothetical protein
MAMTLPVNQGRGNIDAILERIDAGACRRPVLLWTDSVTTLPVWLCGGDGRIDAIGSVAHVNMGGVYFAYRRRVEASGPPRVMAIAAVPEFYEHRLRHGVGGAGFFESTYTRPREIRETLECTGDWTVVSHMALHALFTPPSNARRGAARPLLRSARSAGAAATDDGPPPPGAPRADRAVAIAERARRRGFEMSALTEAFLERLCEETGRDGARLVLVTPAMTPGVAAGWQASGFLAGYLERLRGFARRHRHVTVEPPLQFADIPDEALADSRHLMPGPGREYGRRVVARLLAILAEVEGTGSPR